MKPPSTRDRAEKATIVQRLVNGANGVPPVPIVWGISATVERFNEAMAQADNRTSYSPVVVDPARVQDSGLLKDDIRLDFPAETGRFDTVLLARPPERAKRVTERWRAYARLEDVAAAAVVPLLVRAGAKQAVERTTPIGVQRHSRELAGARTGRDGARVRRSRPDRARRVHGPAHRSRDGAGPHPRPRAVRQGRDLDRLGLPRAEVLLSFRTAKETTHITQLLGRMVRTPLARRVPGNDLLNSVECVLPHFDRSTAARVAKSMLGDREHDDDGTGGGAGRRVLLAPVDMDVNQAIPEAVWEAFDTLPSQTLPRKAARPVRRLAALAPSAVASRSEGKCTQGRLSEALRQARRPSGSAQGEGGGRQHGDPPGRG